MVSSTRIGETFERLQHSPMIGSKRGLFAPGLRVFFYASCAIYQLPNPTQLVVTRVLHGSRDTVAIANEAGSSNSLQRACLMHQASALPSSCPSNASMNVLATSKPVCFMIS